MGDAFSAHQCSTSYLRIQIARLRQLPPEARDARTNRLLELYEEALQDRKCDQRANDLNQAGHA